MKERPITFTAEMITAIREGRKTQTRRVIKEQPKRLDATAWVWSNGRTAYATETAHSETGLLNRMLKHCPYGQPGDRLWVKEWYTTNAFGDVLYLTDWKSEGLEYEGMGWKSSRFMPKKHARLWLDVAGVRIERLQDISNADIRAEGIMQPDLSFTLVGPFIRLWDNINAKRGCGWDANPWVWVVTFKVLL